MVLSKQPCTGSPANITVINVIKIGSDLKVMLAWLRVIIKLLTESATSGTKT